MERMSYMFYKSLQFNQSLLLWNVCNVVNMDSMFGYCKSTYTYMEYRMSDMFEYHESIVPGCLQYPYLEELQLIWPLLRKKMVDDIDEDDDSIVSRHIVSLQCGEK